VKNIISYIDAEYVIRHKEHTTSIVKEMLPTFIGKNLTPSVDMLINVWMRNANIKNYKDVYVNLKVSKDSYDKDEAQKKKFKSWRKGLKLGRFKEISSLIETLFSKEVVKESLVDKYIMYRISYFVNSFFEYLLKVKNAKGDTNIFNSKKELVEWLHSNYELYYCQAYCEVEAQLK